MLLVCWHTSRADLAPERIPGCAINTTVICAMLSSERRLWRRLLGWLQPCAAFLELQNPRCVCEVARTIVFVVSRGPAGTPPAAPRRLTRPRLVLVCSLLGIGGFHRGRGRYCNDCHGNRLVVGLLRRQRPSSESVILFRFRSERIGGVLVAQIGLFQAFARILSNFPEHRDSASPPEPAVQNCAEDYPELSHGTASCR